MKVTIVLLEQGSKNTEVDMPNGSTVYDALKAGNFNMEASYEVIWLNSQRCHLEKTFPEGEHHVVIIGTERISTPVFMCNLWCKDGDAGFSIQVTSIRDCYSIQLSASNDCRDAQYHTYPETYTYLGDVVPTKLQQFCEVTLTMLKRYFPELESEEDV